MPDKKQELQMGFEYEVRAWITEFGAPPEQMIHPVGYVDSLKLQVLFDFVTADLTDEEKEAVEMDFLDRARTLLREKRDEIKKARRQQQLMVAQKPGMFGPDGKPIQM